ncbi:hypothetical protein LN042_31165 [Kitasatospora sp. RB6PN24]|uniref:hypothetical protein n=1 Tax=Kitasatospora humi TaxID=2893891 RepID=UPI001E60598C|nr:hypothetical protein [Kitasatospora humi]MCC9311473.1 hypothetical protein [Kitasatospora humi]
MKKSTLRIRLAGGIALLAAGAAALLGVGHTTGSGAGPANLADDRWGISTPAQNLHLESAASSADGPLANVRLTGTWKDDDRWG